MITLKIDNREVQVPEGSTLLEAATQLGIYIPTLCYAKQFKPSTSCMVCVVRVEGFKNLVPACGARVAENMVVTTQDPHIQNSRKAAIELLLSDHVGDCVGPCMVGCPAKMNIPLMIRQIIANDVSAAIRTVKKDIPLPAILGRICSAPCEKVCRRSQVDSPVSICLLRRFIADADLALEKPFTPDCRPPIGKKAAIIGAGPSGLSAAYYLKLAGVDSVIYDGHEHPGGALRYADIDRSVLPLELVDQEIAQLLDIGIQFKGNTRLGSDVSLPELKSQYDAILLATGKPGSNSMDIYGIETKADIIQAKSLDYSTSEKGVFAAGGCIGSRDLCIRAVADGKEAALSMQSFLLGGRDVPGPEYNHRMGKIKPDEMSVFMKQAIDTARIEPETLEKGLSLVQARQEAARCLHCDCRKADICQLRNLATEWDARQRTWQGEKKLFRQISEHEQIIFEPGKCIQCGLCVQMAKKEGEHIGLSFQGRGFETEITVPLNKLFVCGLTKAAEKCAQICPTGALALKE